MQHVPAHLKPDQLKFSADPFGYAALAGHRWAFAQEVAGAPAAADPQSSRSMKSPVLWLSQAHALSETARIVLTSDPRLEHLPVLTRGICDGQYRAVGLMLIGYSLEVCLKAMQILRLGIDAYEAQERDHHHHDLGKLARWMPDLDEKDRAILAVLTHFVQWAGRYPDPGSKHETKFNDIFDLSEKYNIAAKDVFELASRVMRHTNVIIDSSVK